MLVAGLALLAYIGRLLLTMFRDANRALLELKDKVLADRLADAAARLEDMRQQRDGFRGMAEQAQRAQEENQRQSGAQLDAQQRALDLLEAQREVGRRRARA